MLLPTYAFYLSFLSVLSSPTMAWPVDTLSSIQCTCITFYTYSQPATCTIPKSQNLSWSAAQSFASSHNLDITFASRTAVSRVLEVEKPLPTSVLMRMYGDRGRAKQGPGSRIVCGSYDEAKLKYLGEGKQRSALAIEARRCDGLVSEIVGIILLMLVLYAVGEYVWSRVRATRGRIQLEGDEKDLLAYAEAGSSTTEFNEKRHHTEISTQTES